MLHSETAKSEKYRVIIAESFSSLSSAAMQMQVIIITILFSSDCALFGNNLLLFMSNTKGQSVQNVVGVFFLDSSSAVTMNRSTRSWSVCSKAFSSSYGFDDLQCNL